MSKTITDEKKIDEILNRGVAEVIPSQKDFKKKLLSGKPLRIKLGIDPTSPNVHLGRAIPLLKLRDLQDLGHKIVFIVGDFTGVIGDTSDKDSERPMLSKKEIDSNKKSYFKQVGKIVNLNKAEFRYNSEWLEDLTYREIGEHADQFSVADFISRENIKKRLDSGKRVSLREVLYPLMQGYDSVAIKSDVEIGGTDQKFNLLAGRKLQSYFNQEPQYLLMGPLVNGLDGRKMSSSWGNTINLNDKPEDMYGKIMSLRDNLIVEYFTFCTRIPMNEVVKIEKSLRAGENPKDAKMKLAREIVSMYHGDKSAKKAEKDFVETFQKGGIPADIEEVEANKGEPLQSVVVSAGLVKSNSEFARLIEQGAVKVVDDKEVPVKDPKHKTTKTIIIKIGKRRFLKVRISKKPKKK